ncbi:LysR family transcriptional regulator [Actinoplanes sp. NPDC049596]|uniref:LysR family transcriptional regulator n=1 Tax=unclassified Actinoplanes TaxID=2626549 RepID=UPI00341682E7
MQLDLNLLVALDALLEEGSVGGAARRLHLSEPATSRALGRIRAATGDPILVRSGRSMVPTPRAQAIRTEVHALVERAQAVFTPPGAPDLAGLERAFTLLASDVAISIGSALLERVRSEAPRVVLRFLGEGSATEGRELRDGLADLDIGVAGRTLPEIRVEPLLTDHVVAVVRHGHPLASGRLTRDRFAAAEHVSASRRGHLTGPIDDDLAVHGLERTVAMAVPTFSAAMFVVARTDLVGLMPWRLGRPAIEALGLVALDPPMELPSIEISMSWHQRYDADGAHGWLRDCVRQALSAFDQKL